VLVGVLASLGSTWLRPQRIEAYLAVAVGILVIVLGLWMLWAQRDLVALAMGEAGEPGDGTNRADAHARDHGHDHAHDHPHGHGHGEPVVWHKPRFRQGPRPPAGRGGREPSETARAAGAGYCGRLLPDPAALALLLGALSSGKVLLGLVTGRGCSASVRGDAGGGRHRCREGRRKGASTGWASIWMVRLQIATSLLIVGMGVVLTIRAVSELAALPAG